VYQVGNNKKVILWCTTNQISRYEYCYILHRAEIFLAVKS